MSACPPMKKAIFLCCVLYYQKPESTLNVPEWGSNKCISVHSMHRYEQRMLASESPRHCCIDQHNPTLKSLALLYRLDECITARKTHRSLYSYNTLYRSTTTVDMFSMLILLAGMPIYAQPCPYAPNVTFHIEGRREVFGSQ